MSLTYGSIWGDYGDEKVTGTTQLHPYGTRMVLPDGRVFYYGQTDGAITAGKFLANFTDYPWIHLDIAGPTFVKTKYGYRGKGATGIGVRLLYSFVKNRYLFWRNIEKNWIIFAYFIRKSNKFSEKESYRCISNFSNQQVICPEKSERFYWSHRIFRR